MSEERTSSGWEDVIQQLIEKGYIRSDEVHLVMGSVDRKHYVPQSLNPYLDSPLPLGFGVTISAPHMHALALEILKDCLFPGARVLDVGTCTGYLTACMALMVGSAGLTVGTDNVPELVEMSRENILRGNPILFSWNTVILEEAEGRLGYPSYAPYDVIHVGAAMQNVPIFLMQQLAPGGRMLVPVGNLRSYQFLTQVDKQHNGEIFIQKIMSVKFVPLTDRSYQDINYNEFTNYDELPH